MGGRWKTAAIGDVCSFFKGASVPRARMYDSGEVYYLHYGDLYKGHELYVDMERPSKPIPFISDSERIKESQVARDEDIVYVLTSETVEDLGKALMLRNPRNYRVVAGTETTIMRVEDTATVNPAYLNYLIQTDDFKKKLRQYVTGMKVFRVHPRDISRIDVEVPELSVQAKTVALLDSIYDKIALNTRMNGCLEELAKLFFVCALDNTKDTVRLSEIASINPSRKLAKGATARCIDMARLSTMQAFPDGWIQKPYNGGMRFRNGDTIFARISPCLENGKASFVNYLDEDEVAFGSTEYIVMCPANDYPAEFFYCLARYQPFIDYATSNMNGSSGRQRVSAQAIGAYELPVPDAEAIAEFRSVVPCLFSKMLSNSLESATLAALRDALLPKLMSGEIDVSEVDVGAALPNSQVHGC